REQGDVTVGVAGIERPAVAGVEFVDLGPVLGAVSSHVCLHGWGGGSGSSCRSAAGRDSGRAPRPAQLTSLPAHPMVAGMTQGLYSAIAARWAEAPGADAIIEDSGAWTRADLCELAGRIHGALHELGAEPGRPVCVIVEKSVQAFATYLACLRGGYAFFPINAGYTDSEIEYL